MIVCKIKSVIPVLGKGMILVVENPKNFQFKHGTLFCCGWNYTLKVQAVISNEEFTNDNQVGLFLADEVDESVFHGQENILVLEDDVDVASDKSVERLIDDNIRLRARLRSLRSRCYGIALSIFDSGCKDGLLRIVSSNKWDYEHVDREIQDFEKRMRDNCPNVEWTGEGETTLPYCMMNGEICDTRCMWH